MCSADLFVEASGNGHDGVRALRCVACGEIIDLVIVQNRLRERGQRFVRREKRFRQPVHAIPAFEWPVSRAFIENRS